MPYLEKGTLSNWLFGTETPNEKDKCLRKEWEVNE